MLCQEQIIRRKLNNKSNYQDEFLYRQELLLSFSSVPSFLGTGVIRYSLAFFGSTDTLLCRR